MDHERKELLAQKKAQLKKRQKRAEIQQYKDRLTKSIEHFSQNSILSSRGSWRSKKFARIPTKMFTCAF